MIKDSFDSKNCQLCANVHKRSDIHMLVIIIKRLAELYSLNTLKVKIIFIAIQLKNLLSRNPIKTLFY
jgi:hypothetical protein